ncbi:MAG: NADH-ubiquinone oxidoreductase-F iron-sulfur binding region domain-containing protein [Candidatus Micrarchaeia archaeon]|jgi:NADH:ubiquinone oxidoreductase subunit F (NADH-binding)
MQILRQTKMEALEKARALGPEGVIALLGKKGLEGRGGAAYPTAKKWKTCRDAPAGERFVVCNADEGEPGTFKDKLIIRHNAETLVEGILVAAYAVGAKRCFIYLRGEYDYLRPRLQEQIDGVLAHAGMEGVTIEIVRGAGAYICGEATALLQSIMGFRGNAMAKPPNPTTHGLWGKPTVINNVETLTCAAQAVLFDDWDPALRLFSISGNVKNPGVYEFPLGVKMSTVIDVARPEKKLKAMSFGCFGGIMPVDADMPITPETICMEKCQHGAYSIVFIDETNNVVDVAYSIAKFYTYESCGKCTPCREGTIRMLNLLKKVRSGKAVKKDLDLMRELALHVQETSLCGLGQTCGNHILTSLEHFPKDYEAYMKK